MISCCDIILQQDRMLQVTDYSYVFVSKFAMVGQ